MTYFVTIGVSQTGLLAMLRPEMLIMQLKKKSVENH